MKNKSRKRIRKKAGAPPGSIIFTGSQKVEQVHVHYLQYNKQAISEAHWDKASTITFRSSEIEQIDWYDIRGLHDTQLIESLGSHFAIHNLILEDIVDINQRPKFEEYDNDIFIIIRALAWDKDGFIKTEQVGIFFREGLVLSFQEDETDLFAAVRDRLLRARGRIREQKADYLGYALLDNIVDNYYVVLDELEVKIEQLEDAILTNPEQSVKAQIHLLKKELLTIRKSIAPLREAISRFTKSESPLIAERTKLFLRDLYDHTVQIMDTVETYRDLLNGVQDLYLSEISFKMNQVMQVLTVITSIFVPLSFLTGLYGMNFEYIPELQYRYGYFILLGVMGLIFWGLLHYFRKKKWF